MAAGSPVVRIRISLARVFLAPGLVEMLRVVCEKVGSFSDSTYGIDRVHDFRPPCVGVVGTGQSHLIAKNFEQIVVTEALLVHSSSRLTWPRSAGFLLCCSFPFVVFPGRYRDMAESSGPRGAKPRLYRIVEVSQEELEGMMLGPEEVENPDPRGHSDHGVHHDHDYGGSGTAGDHDHDHPGGHTHSHPQ
jgi:hypothetical protein